MREGARVNKGVLVYDYFGAQKCGKQRHKGVTNRGLDVAGISSLED